MNVFNASVISELQRDSAIAFFYTAVFDSDVSESIFTFGAELNCRTGGYESTALDDNVFAGTIGHSVMSVFENDTVISRSDPTIGYSDIFTVIGIDAVTVCKS